MKQKDVYAYLKKSNWLAAVLLLHFNILYAYTQKNDSIVTPKIIIQMDNRGSFIRGQSVTIWGGKVGLEVYPYRFGVGYYNLFKTLTVQLPPNKNATTAELGVEFSYVSVFLDRILLQNKRWELSTTANVGYSSIIIRHNISEQIFTTKERHSPLGELSIQGHYKFLPWAAIGVGAGYRVLFDTQNVVRKDFDAPIYTLKLKIFPMELMQSIQRKKQVKV